MCLHTLVFSSAAFLVSASLAQSGAPVTIGNPPGVQYIAVLPTSQSPNGSVVASSTPSGTGVDFQITISGLPSQGGPFRELSHTFLRVQLLTHLQVYHIHENPVAPNGSCATVGGHLDPYNITDIPICNSTCPEDCQVGDLSGKHGAMSGTNFVAK